MNEQQEDSFISHLVELRDRLLRAVVAVVVVFVCLMPWAGDIYDILAHPMMTALPEGTKMIATGVVTPFFVPMKVTLLVAFVIALPFVLYQAWCFIAPGLYAHEKRLGLPLVVGSTVLFLAGMAFCYFFVFGTVFKFIAQFAPKSITPAPDIEQYLAFVMSMFLAFAANLSAYLQMLARQEDPDTLFFNRELEITGDTELGLIVKNMLDAIEWPQLSAKLPLLRH